MEKSRRVAIERNVLVGSGLLWAVATATGFGALATAGAIGLGASGGALVAEHIVGDKRK